MSKNKNKIKNKNIFENIYFQKNQKDLIAIEKFNSNNDVAVNLNFLEIEKGMLLRRIDSKKAVWNKEKKQWELNDFSIRNFDDIGSENQ